MFAIYSPRSKLCLPMMNRDNRSSFRANALIIICALLLNGDLARFIGVVLAEECTHDECLEQANQLAESIDAMIDPCDDFVEFACGNAFARFEENAVTNETDERSLNQYFVTPTRHTAHLWWLRRMIVAELNRPYQIEEHRIIGLTKMYWQSCKITSANEALAGVRILLKRLGGWPLITEDWQDKHFTWDKFGKCARLLGFLPRMFVHIGLNDEDVEKPWFMNDTIELTIERSKYMYTREDMATTMERAFEYLKIADYISENKKPDVAEIEEALQFGKRIHLVGFAWWKDNKTNRDAIFLNNLIDTLTHSQEMPIIEQKVMSINKLQKTYPFVNWMDYIRSMLTRRQANYLSDRNCVIADVCYLSQIGNLLESTDKRVQANYAFLSIIDDLSLFIRPQLSLTFAANQREIEQICFDSVAAIFRKALEMILAKLAGQRTRQRVEEVQTIVAQQARQIFHRIPWMDHQTQLEAGKKSERTSFVKLFEDDMYEDRYFDRLEFTQPDATLVLFREINVFLVDRYYLQLGRPRNSYIIHRRDNHTMFAIFKTPFSPAETMVRPDRISNQIYIPAASVLHGRFSVLRELDFLNYATLGLQIANAMGHQIYQRGSYIDCNGHWREPSWWSKATQRQFASRQSCIDVGKVKPLEEMSPIFGFIGAAEIAYKSMFETSSNVGNTTLPGLSYTTRQLFWIVTVASDCDRNLKQRYNTMVAHNFNFAQDFNCPSGSRMNVTDKCKMWIA